MTVTTAPGTDRREDSSAGPDRHCGSPVVVITSGEHVGMLAVRVEFECSIVETWESSGSAGFISVMIELVAEAHECVRNS